MAMYRMRDVPLSGQRVLIRMDLNVPVANGVVTSDARIRASLPTIRTALAQGAKLMLMSHLGRPTEGVVDADNSLRPVAEHLSSLLGVAVPLVTDYLERAPELGDGEVVLLENVRFNKGEKSDDPALSKAYASLCDVYVMDAFGTAHRAQASTHGVGLVAPVACAGPLLEGELDALGKALDNPARPMVAIVGGSKVSTKLSVLDALSTVVDQLIVGGGIANTFVAAAGHTVGKSLYEPDLVPEAARLLSAAREAGGEIPVPSDVVVGAAFEPDAQATTRPAAEVGDEDMIFDIGPDTTAALCELISKAGTIVWNGPVGVFEFDQFSAGTRALGEAIASSSAFSIAGGGDTLAAVDKYDLADRISYISTGGGAFLEFLEGKTLPAVAMLNQRADDNA